MPTLREISPSRKPSRAYHAILDDANGALCKIDHEILFMNSASGEIITIEPEHCTFLVVLGEIGLADTQQIRHYRG